MLRVASSRWVLFLLLPCLLTIITARSNNNLHSLLKRQSCNNFQQQGCDEKTGSDCVDEFCRSCSAEYPDIAQCCATSESLAQIGCFQQILNGGLQATATTGQTNQAATKSLSSASSFPTAPSNNSSVDACASFQSAVARCDSATPGFENLTPFAAQASCICYSSSTYIGNSYDAYFSSCLDQISRIDPSGYSSILKDGPITSSPCAVQTKAIAMTSTVPRSSRPSSTSRGGDGDFLNHSASPALTTSTSNTGPAATLVSPTTSSTPTGAATRVSAFSCLGIDPVRELNKS